MTILWPTLRAGWLLSVAVLTTLTVPPRATADQKVTSTASKELQLCGIRWQPTVEAALKVANQARQEKPVMVFRVLGDLDGFM